MLNTLQARDLVSIVAVVATFAVPVLIVAMAFTYKAYAVKMKHKVAALDDRVLRRLDEMAERFNKIERRLANLETIVLEREKHNEFDRAL